MGFSFLQSKTKKPDATKKTSSSRRKASETERLREESNALLDEINKYESLILEAPGKIARQREEKQNTMPAPEELEDRRREKKFHSRLSRGQVRNEHRYQAKNGTLFILLTIAAIALFSWAWKIFSAG